MLPWHHKSVRNNLITSYLQRVTRIYHPGLLIITIPTIMLATKCHQNPHIWSLTNKITQSIIPDLPVVKGQDHNLKGISQKRIWSEQDSRFWWMMDSDHQKLNKANKKIELLEAAVHKKSSIPVGGWTDNKRNEWAGKNKLLISLYFNILVFSLYFLFF